MPWGKARHHGHEAHHRRKHTRRKAHEMRKKRKKAVKDRRMGRRGHTHTVNAPHTW